MSFGLRIIVREMGTALAVLAVYLLVLLAPLHQASALQHDLAELGYASTTTFDICGPQQDRGEKSSSEFTCHVAGIDKFEFAAILPAPASVTLPRLVARLPWPTTATLAPISAEPHVAQARAPPVKS